MPKSKVNLQALVDRINATSNADFVKRLLSGNKKHIIDSDGKRRTHRLGYVESDGRAIVFPEVQSNGDTLREYPFPQSLDRAIARRDTLMMSIPEAEAFTTGYKEYYPDAEFGTGGKIHIKPSHRGRLTELKERTGKSEAELYNDGNPAHKKMVVFARNARKWKHSEGGLLKRLFSREEEPAVTALDFSGLKTTNNRKYNPEYISYINDSLKAGGMDSLRRAAVLANIIEESGGDPFALDKTGKFYGLLQWTGDRYVPTEEKDVYREIDNQVKYILDTAGNTTDKKSWTHGGVGSGYNSYTEAIDAYNGDALEDVMRGYTLGYVRPAGKVDSYNNRLNVAQQLYDLQGFKEYACGGRMHRYDGETEPTGQMNPYQGFMWKPEDAVFTLSPQPEHVMLTEPIEKTTVEEPVEQTTPPIIIGKVPLNEGLLVGSPVQRDSFPPAPLPFQDSIVEADFNSPPVVVPDRDSTAYFAGKVQKLTDDLGKYDPKGKSHLEIRALQKELADEGYYSGQLVGKSKEEIKAIQTKLINKGLLSNEKKADGTYKEVDGVVGGRTRAAWNQYNVDGRWGTRSAQAYDSRRRATSQSGQNWEGEFSTKGVDGCAKWVTRKYESVLGKASRQNGVIGNAWQMPMNVVRAGGTMLFNLYKDGFDDVNDEATLKKRTRERLKEEHIDYSILRPGDVVGIFYPGSHYHETSLREGTTYNTHVGIVTGYDEDGMPLVEHNINEKHHKDRADRISYGVGAITVASRPHHTALEQYPFALGSSKYDVELPENAKPEQVEKLHTFMDSMAGASDVIGGIYNNADMDAVQKIAIGVLQRETGMMQNTESSRTGKASIGPAIRKLYHEITGTRAEQKSSDLTKFKLATLSPDERAFLGITDAKDLEDPAKAGLASMLTLAKNYDYFVRYAKQNPQLGLTKQDIEDLTALSYNQGMGRLYKVGTVEFDGKQYKAPSRLDAIREAAASDEVIDDFKATKLGRIAQEFPILTDMMKELYDRGVGTRSTSYMNSARRAIQKIKTKQ